MTDVLRVMSERKIPVSGFPISAGNLAAMIRLILDGTISGKIAKVLFEEMLVSDEEPGAIVKRKGMVQVSDAAAIERVIDQVIGANRPQVDKFIGGNEKVFAFLVGETMKAMKGKANPKVVNEVLRRRVAALKG
jgi:aspartyl-tRNA(Asn)/glutamyl-tRNA(Gln) amidotransferase subunit B